jgi:hypothetical protein
MSQAISLVTSGKSEASLSASRAHHEGRIAIVTDVGRGMRWPQMVPKTNALLADGEVLAF